MLMAGIIEALQVMGELGLYSVIALFLLVAILIFALLYYFNKFSKQQLKEELSEEFVRKLRKPA